MKKLGFISCFFVLFLGLSCQKKDTQLTEQVAKLEQRIEVLEKRLTAAPAQPPQQAEQTAAYDLPIGESYVWGNANAPLTLVEFSDIQCPFCARAHEPFIEKIFADPQLKDKVKVVFKHYPLSFHQNALPASKAALAAGEQGHDCFWQMTKKLYNGQRELTEDNFKKWASETECIKKDGKSSKIDATKFWNDYTAKDAAYRKMIEEDQKLANKANVRGTPTFFLNGWKLNQRSVEAIKQLAEEKGLLAAKP